jgi:hypothetical protein
LVSFSELKDDKLIDRVTLMAILEDVFRNALKKKYGSDDNFDIIINPDKGDMEIWRNRVVVADGEVEDENQEIELSEAQKIEPDFEVGEDVSEEVKLIDLGRRAILALRQNLISKIHEHDNNNLYKQFKDLILNEIQIHYKNLNINLISSSVEFWLLHYISIIKIRYEKLIYLKNKYKNISLPKVQYNKIEFLDTSDFINQVELEESINCIIFEKIGEILGIDFFPINIKIIHPLKSNSHTTINF